jgi:hypothetical protein
MSYKIEPAPPKQTSFEESLYCGDPNCVHCKELREMQDYLRSSRFGKKWVTLRRGDFQSDLKPDKENRGEEKFES